MFTQSGIPVIYSGDEIGQCNDYSYKANPHKAADSRYVHRGAFRWDLAQKRFEEETPQYKIFRSIQKMEEIRAREKVFSTDAAVWTIDTWDASVLGIIRSYEGEKLIALFNFGDQDKTAWINEEGIYEDLITGRQMEGKAVPIPKGGMYWLKQIK